METANAFHIMSNFGTKLAFSLLRVKQLEGSNFFKHIDIHIRKLSLRALLKSILFLLS